MSPSSKVVPKGTEQEPGAKTLTARLGTLSTSTCGRIGRGENSGCRMYDATVMPLIEDDFLRIASNNAVDNGQRMFEFKSVAIGTHRLVFEKRMGWKFTAEDRQIFYVTVS